MPRPVWNYRSNFSNRNFVTSRPFYPLAQSHFRPKAQAEAPLPALFFCEKTAERPPLIPNFLLRQKIRVPTCQQKLKRGKKPLTFFLHTIDKPLFS